MASASPANSPAPAASTSPSSAPPAFDPEPLCSALDAHLERYLHLLAEYTSLRETLHAQLSSGFLSLAQANFTAPSHIRRYGQDYYDERAKALRRVTFDEPNDNEITPRVAVTKFQPRMEEADDPEKPNKRSQGPPDEADATPSKAKEEEDDQQQQQAKAGGKEKKRRKQGGAVDPLNWYGVLVPGQLRAAQAEFAAAVEGPVPRLSALRAEMREVEAEVGRARKAIRKGLGGGKG